MMTIEGVIYLCAFMLGFALSFLVLRALHIEKKFAQGQIRIIRLAFLLGSIIMGHLFAECVVAIYNALPIPDLNF